MKNPILKYGLISGGLLLLLMSVPHLVWGSGIDYSMGEILGYSSMIVSMTVIFFGIRAFRDQKSDGVITFTQGMKAGTGIGLIAAAMFAVYSWILYRFLWPEFLHDYFEYSRDQVLESGESRAVISEKIAEMESMAGIFLNPELQALVMFATVFVIALIVTLVSTLILKTKQV
ncbi:MAG: DUF4199 domain-containing protein [Balneolaceae bacterium]